MFYFDKYYTDIVYYYCLRVILSRDINIVIIRMFVGFPLFKLWNGFVCIACKNIVTVHAYHFKFYYCIFIL